MRRGNSSRVSAAVMAQAVAFYVGVFLLKYALGCLGPPTKPLIFAMRFASALAGVSVSVIVGMMIEDRKYWRPTPVFWIGLAYAIASLFLGGWLAQLIITNVAGLGVYLIPIIVVSVVIGLFFRQFAVPAGIVSLLLCVLLAGTLLSQLNQPYGETYVIFGGGFVLAGVTRLLKGG